VPNTARQNSIIKMDPTEKGSEDENRLRTRSNKIYDCGSEPLVL